MTLSPILPTHDADSVALDFGVFIARRARRYRTSQTAIIAALRPIIEPVRHSGDDRPLTPDAVERLLKAIDEIEPTPSQPERAPRAPAADTSTAATVGETTDGEAESSSLPTPPSVEPIPEAPKPLPDAPDIPADALVHPAEAKTSDQGALSSEPAGMQDQCASIPATPSAVFLSTGNETKTRTKGQQNEVLRVHNEHRDWPAKVIGAHLGVSQEYVNAAARRLGIKLPTQRAYDAAQAAKTTAALSAPKKPETPPAVTSVAAKPIQHRVGPPATTARQVQTVTAPNEPRRVVPTRAPVGAGSSTRFYVRDDKGRWLHQSLERSPTDTGPLMTVNRKWAWFDNAQRYAGACKKWPEISTMRREAPNA